MALTNPINVTATCVALEQRLGESTVTLRFNSPENNELLGISNLGDFVFKMTNVLASSQFIVGETYTVTLQ
jgi:hypothetical protein